MPLWITCEQMPSAYHPNGVRTRRQIESDAFKLVVFRQKELGRKLTGPEKAGIVRHEFEDEARRIANARFPRGSGSGSGSAGTLNEIIRQLMADRFVLPRVSGTENDPTKREGVA